MTNLDSILKSKDITLLTKFHIVKSIFFFSSHVWMWELDHKKGWALKNWYFGIVALQKTLESPLDSKEIKAVNPKGNQPWIFIGRTDVKAEAPILQPLMWRVSSLEKTLMPGKIEGRRIRGWQRMRCLGGIANSMHMSLSKLQETVKNREAWCAVANEVAKSWAWLGDWITAPLKLKLLK